MKQILTWIGIQLIKAGLVKLTKIIEAIDTHDAEIVNDSYTANELPKRKRGAK